MATILVLDIDFTLTDYSEKLSQYAKLEAMCLSHVTLEWAQSFSDVVGVYGSTHRRARLIPSHFSKIENFIDNDNIERIKKGKSARDSDSVLMSRVFKNFLSEAKLEDKFCEISTPGDKGRGCGVEYKEDIVPYEGKLIASKADTGRYVFPEIKKVESEEYPDHSKNIQLFDIFADAEKRFGKGHGHVFHFVDDMADVCAFGAHLALPSDVDLRVYLKRTDKIVSVPRMVLLQPRLSSFPSDHKIDTPLLKSGNEIDEYHAQVIRVTNKMFGENKPKNLASMIDSTAHFLRQNQVILSDYLIEFLFKVKVKKSCCFFYSYEVSCDLNAFQKRLFFSLTDALEKKESSISMTLSA